MSGHISDRARFTRAVSDAGKLADALECGWSVGEAEGEPGKTEASYELGEDVVPFVDADGTVAAEALRAALLVRAKEMAAGLAKAIAEVEGGAK